MKPVVTTIMTGVLAGVTALMLSACGSGSNEDKQVLQAPPAVEIETPPMPDVS